MLFGVLSIIMDIFKIASYVGYIHCDSAVKVAFPAVQLVFVLVQVNMSKYVKYKEIRNVINSLSLQNINMIVQTIHRHTFCGSTPKTVCRYKRTLHGRWLMDFCITLSFLQILKYFDTLK